MCVCVCVYTYICICWCVCCIVYLCIRVYILCCVCSVMSMTPWTVAYQSPLSLESSRQEYYGLLPSPTLGIFLIQGPNPHLLCLLHWQADSLPATSATWEDHTHTHTHTHTYTHSLFCTPKLIQSYVLLLAAKSLQLCPTLCNPRDSSPPGLPVPGILQARTLEWAAISFSNA